MKEFLSKFWEVWKRFGRFMGNLITRVILTLLYFTVFVPFGIGARLFTDPLHVKSDREESWSKRSTGDKTLEELMRQF
ncbi:MAG: hypothetical protein GWN00_32355 [Aliifodinibius sp.]|nr:hypothetical protein [Fodinibius sp.]NIV12359.1 hypothetical protein [Fodinibius sp.]NIY29311.1 hypothetical protein [Fodinibius sp.]